MLLIAAFIENGATCKGCILFKLFFCKK